MSEEEMIYILRNREMLLNTLRTKREMVCGETCTIDEQIQDLVLQGKKLREDVLSPTNDNKDKMLQTLERQQRRCRQEVIALNEELDSLAEQEKTITKVWTCFRCLPLQDFELLNDLYVKNEKWDVIATQRGISKSTIRKARRLAVKKLMVLTNSKQDDIKSLKALSSKFSRGFAGRTERAESEKEAGAGQLTLKDFMKN